MEKMINFTDRATIAREAGEWVIKLEGDTPPTAEDYAVLKEWLSRSPAHREEINSLANFWGSMNVLTELAVPLGKTDSQVANEQASAWPTNRGGFAIAASLFSMVCLLGIAYLGFFQSTGNGLYATVVGQQTSTTLNDGSVIQLNTNTQLAVSYSRDYRDIRLLQGEAHFTVAKNPERPFRVRVGNGQVQAIGTAFSVYLNGQNVDVTVTEGRVGLAVIEQGRVKNAAIKQLAINKELGQLNAGQGTTIKNAVVSTRPLIAELEKVESISQDELARRLLWRKGLLKFNGNLLEEVIQEISRYTSLSIEITDPAVRGIRIGGQFRVGDTDGMLQSLETNFGIHVERIEHNKVQLSLSKK